MKQRLEAALKRLRACVAWNPQMPEQSPWFFVGPDAIVRAIKEADATLDAALIPTTPAMRDLTFRCKLCSVMLQCENSVWFTTCTCAKDRPDKLKAAQEKWVNERRRHWASQGNCARCGHPLSWHSGALGCNGVPGEMRVGQPGECGCTGPATTITRVITVYDRCTQCEKTLYSMREGESGLCAMCWMNVLPQETKESIDRLIASAFTGAIK